MQSNDQGGVPLCRSDSRGGEQCRADSCCLRAGGCPCAGSCSRSRSAPGMVFDVASTAAIAARLSGSMGQSASGSPAGAGPGQPALAHHDAGATVECPAALCSMARHAPGAAPAIAPALAAVQGHAAGTAAAGARILQPVPANAARKAHGVAPAVASNDSGAAPPRYPAGAAAAAAQSALMQEPRRLTGDSCVRRVPTHPGD
jgi:hypothetical protein